MLKIDLAHRGPENGLFMWVRDGWELAALNESTGSCVHDAVNEAGVERTVFMMQGN